HNRTLIQDSGQPDNWFTQGGACPVDQLPTDTLAFLLPSRYCEVDSELMAFAWQQFGALPEGWARVRAVCDFVHAHLRFDYQCANSQRSALGAYRERVGVCRDFTHLALTLCRCLNIPSRYVTGYLGDIGVPAVPYPMDFSAWFEVWIDGAWHSVDARHNTPRIGYDIELELQAPTALVFLLQVHPDRAQDLREPDLPLIDPPLLRDVYLDAFGNWCIRVHVPAGDHV
ncbi:MAG: transglutaminase family protein, partial [Comamonadaceae bacterium]